MSFSPISFISPNFRDFKNEWLKAYEPGTTTPKVMALESNGGTQVSKLQLNVDGFIVSAGAALVIPYIDGAYDLWLFPTEAEADANDTVNAIRVADDITSVSNSSIIADVTADIINDLSQAYEFATVAAYKAFATAFTVGKIIHLLDRDDKFLVISGVGTADGKGIIASDQVSQSIEIADNIGITDASTYGDMSVADTAPVIISANDPTGSTVTIPKGNNLVNSAIEFGRFSSLIGAPDDVHQRSTSRLTWTGAAGEMIKTTSDFGAKSLRLDGNNVAGTKCFQIGNDLAFEHDVNLKDLWIRQWDTGLEFSNAFDVRVENVRIEEGRLGIHLVPVSFGDGGYTTTVKFSQVYVTNNSEEGFLDDSPVKNKMLCIGDNSVFELNGDATHPQVKIKEGQVNSLNELYVEDGGNVATGISMQNGYLQNAYINGFGDAGVDLTAFTSRALIDNVKFVGGIGPSVLATGASNSKYVGMRLCEFSTVPSLNGLIVEYQGCTGMPGGLPDNAHIITGTQPAFGVGTTPAVTRDIEVWSIARTGESIPAHSQVRFNVAITSGRVSDGLSALTVTPQKQMAVGIIVSVERMSDSAARIVISNITVASVATATTDFLVRLERFSAVNS